MIGRCIHPVALNTICDVQKIVHTVLIRIIPNKNVALITELSAIPRRVPATRANRRNADSVLPLIRIPIAAPLTAISAKAIWNRQKV